MADIEFNAIPTGVEYGQLTDTEKRHLLECLQHLLPFGWTSDVLQNWFRNRKLSVIRDGDTTQYYGAMPGKKWRLLLEDTNGTLAWKVGTFQWTPKPASTPQPTKRL